MSRQLIGVDVGGTKLGHALIGAQLDHGTPRVGDFPQEGSLESLASGRALDALAEEHGCTRVPGASFSRA